MITAKIMIAFFFLLNKLLFLFISSFSQVSLSYYNTTEKAKGSQGQQAFPTLLLEKKMGTGPIFCCYALKLRMSFFVQNGACPHFFPISSASLDERFGKAKSSKSLHPFLCILPTQNGREPIYQTHIYILTGKNAGLVNQTPTNKTSPYVKKSAGLMN